MLERLEYQINVIEKVTFEEEGKNWAMYVVCGLDGTQVLATKSDNFSSVPIW